MLLIFVLVRLKPGLAPIMTQRASLSEKLTSLRGCWAVGLLAIVVIGGMYTGAVSPSSAGTVGACRSEEHTSELQSLMRISYAVFCLKKKTKTIENTRY